jgi:hypothetical protein
MKENPGWPEGFFERLQALALDLPDDFQRPEPLPQSPDREPLVEPSPGHEGGTMQEQRPGTDAGPAPSG